MQTVSLVEAVPAAPLKSRGICLPPAIADGLARHHAQEQLIYKKKLKMLKKVIKNLVLENAALCDVVASSQEDLALAIEEKQNLIRKFIQINKEPQIQQSLKAQKSNEEKDKQLIRKYWQEEKKPSWNIYSNKSLLNKKKSFSSTFNQINNSHFKLKQGNSKEKKTHTKKSIKNIKKKCASVPLDSTGRPIFPIILDSLTIHSLGEIVTDKKSYHTEKCIYPVGFCSSRSYASLKNPHKQTLYTCTIKDGGPGPRFDIICDEDELTFYGNTPAECHCQILQKINIILGLDLLPTNPDTTEAEDRGLRFFGLSHPSVQNMIQICPGARKCSKYKWIQFEVCKHDDEWNKTREFDREASICHETLLRNIRFAKNHM